MIITACGGGAGDEEQPLAPDSGTNSAPVIGGDPPTTASIGEPFTFRPEVLDADGDLLHFTAAHVPTWASVDPNTGKLTGIPRTGEEGRYSGITIRVSDGRAEAALPAFSIDVRQYATGRASLSWDAPREYTDGAPLIRLAGYRIEYGRDRNDPDRYLLIGNPSINTALLEGLSPGQWYFALVALDSRSIESKPSTLASTTVY